MLVLVRVASARRPVRVPRMELPSLDRCSKAHTGATSWFGKAIESQIILRKAWRWPPTWSITRFEVGNLLGVVQKGHQRKQISNPLFRYTTGTKESNATSGTSKFAQWHATFFRQHHGLLWPSEPSTWQLSKISLC